MWRVNPEARRGYLGFVGAPLLYGYHTKWGETLSAFGGRNRQMTRTPRPFSVRKAALATNIAEEKLIAIKISFATSSMMGKSKAQIIQIETNIDDMNPQWFDSVMDNLFKAGCVDVSLQPIQMKKNRPGILLKALCPASKKERAIEIILRETTTLGVRYFPVKRKILKRQMKVIHTKHGKIPIKIAFDKKLGIRKSILEYDACKKQSCQKRIPIRFVYEEILRNLKS